MMNQNNSHKELMQKNTNSKIKPKAVSKMVVSKLAAAKKLAPKKPATNKQTNKTTAKKPAAKNSLSKKTQPKKPRKKAASKSSRGQNKRTWRQILWSLTWKCSLVLIAVLVVMGFYLNSLVEERFDGQLFDLPTVVYARILTLTPDNNMSLQVVRNELDILNYRKVGHPRYPGEYSASSTKIELIRRPFEFADGPEPDKHVMLYFNHSGLQRIHSLETNKNFGYLRLDPKMLGMLDNTHDQQRLFLHRRQFPEFMVDALLTTEDRDFYRHDGVKPLAIARALVANIKAGHTVQGGSTLTQQLAKNLFLTRDRTLWRKLREAYLALILDAKYSKDRILEAYLNEVYLGQSGGEAINGFGLASRYYFGQPIDELRLDQQAMLVAMVKGPSYYNPIRKPERTKKRRDLVLRLLMQQGILTAHQYEQAAIRPLGIQKHPKISTKQPAYFQQLRIELKKKVAKHDRSINGLRVFTSLDPVSQHDLEQAVAAKMPQLAKRAHAGKALETAAIAVDRHSGEIRAMVGGRRAEYSGFNRALNASRQIGSLVKPAIYLTALSHPEQYTLATTLHDEPLRLKGNHGSIWTPRNFDRKFRGDVPLYMALAHSMNVPTVRLGMNLGMKQVIHTLDKLGINPSEIRPVPSMFLGAFSLAPIQVAQMFQTITNSGQRAPLTALRSVVDMDGDIVFRSLPKSSQVVAQQAAWLTTYAMKQVVLQGTGRYLQRHFSKSELAGKTGTSNDSRDSWFVGVDGREVTTVWVGRDDNKPTRLTGASGALRIYVAYLQKRIPEHLQLPWPKQITTLGFKKNSKGGLVMDCNSHNKLPVWDKTGKIKQQCQKDASWLGGILNW